MLLHETIRIEAPPRQVWNVTTDVLRWPVWTPTVTSVRALEEGEIRIGARFALKQPMQAEAVWEVTELDPPHRFAWRRMPRRALEGKTTGGVQAVHALTPAGTGTENRLELEMPGLAWLILPLLRRALRAENAGLKKHCEIKT
ncbi:SRPBCC family protein [Pseudoruegeria sp. HB172150]|uniref:SRPBCC family protein n=1 Tax=Pseudoruegeria sp. HB172150 TaxID=2721164 RepID=UPI0015526F4D|nr:SRPBCC family protein [Pseudoruegeria sp. HB172150]